MPTFIAESGLLHALTETMRFPVTILCIVLAGIVLSRHLRGHAATSVPRWQQGLRPHAFGPTWDAMTPVERRGAFIGDIVVATSGVIFVYWLWAFMKALG